MSQKQQDILIWICVLIVLFLVLYGTEQGERGKVAGRILVLAVFIYKSRDTYSKLKK